MWKFLMHDIQGLAASWDIFDLTGWVLLGVWFLVLFMPLNGIERRDPVVALTYLVFMLAIGAILAYAATPEPVTDTRVQSMISTFLIATTITAIRFYYRRSKIVISTPLFTDSKEKMHYE